MARELLRFLNAAGVGSARHHHHHHRKRLSDRRYQSLIAILFRYFLIKRLKKYV